VIRLPTRSRRDGDDEPYRAASVTWRVEWDHRDEEGRELPSPECVVRLVTPFGEISRRVRLRLAGETTGA
jgi:hypothetical protein